MQIPILSGIYADTTPDLRIAYPQNMVAEVATSGISNGYLRLVEGVNFFADLPGVDRGGINWRDECYRVAGSKLIKVGSNGAITILGEVGDGWYVTFSYGFDRLGIASSGKLFYWDGVALTQVTDPDLGTVVDFKWSDGYYVATDGEYLVATDLLDPTQVNNLKYGSAEASPDPILALLRLKNELCALNRYTIEFFDNTGGDYFPFSRLESAQIQRGVVGTHACCLMGDAILFMGSGVNEQVGIYIAGNGSSAKISTSEIDRILSTYDEETLAASLLEYRHDKTHDFLYVHLPDKTLLFDATTTKDLQQSPVWSILSSGQGLPYRAKNFVWCYGNWICGDPVEYRLGVLDYVSAAHWGDIIEWEFSTAIMYPESFGAIVHNLELVLLPSSTAARISTSYSVDGVTWSQPKSATVPTNTPHKRLAWRRQGFFRQWRIQRFSGDSRAKIAAVRLEAVIEPLGGTTQQ